MKNQLPVILLSLLLTLSFTLPAVADRVKVEQVVLVLWHGLEWAQLDSLHFATPRAIGLLNTRVGGGESVTASYLSLGAGARAVGLNGSAHFYQTEAGRDLYRRHTGLEPTPLVQPRIAQIRAAQTVQYKLEVGALGSALSQIGRSPRVLGTSDAHEPFNWAALVGMDGWGRVWEGSVGTEFLIQDSDYPYGIRTDYQKLSQEVRESKDALVIVDLGDPFRYDQYRSNLVQAQQEKLESLITGEAKDFLEGIIEGTPAQTAVLLLSPYPSQPLANRNFWLTPVVCWGLGEGLLTSATTRWPGLITNMDIAPAVLEMLGVEHSQPFIGRPISVRPVAEAEGKVWMEAMADKVGFHAQYRGHVLRTLVVGQIITYTAVLISLIVNSIAPRWAVRTLQLAILVLLAAPLGLLLWDRAPLAALGLLIGVSALKWKGVSTVRLIGLISLGTALAISVDVLFGSWLMRYSFLGYDPIAGARFYGIGNEYMGVLIGSAIMGWVVTLERLKLSDRQKEVCGLIVFGFFTVVIGAPNLGTNVGGSISAVVGFGSTLLALAGKRLNLRTVLALVLATVVVLTALMIVDDANSQGEQSHIGQTVKLIRRDGLSAILLIIVRKLNMNLRLLRYSMWSNALVVAMAGIGASFIWPSRYIYWLKENHPLIAGGIVGVVIGSMAAFFFNDSGVVAAATCLSFASSSLLILALELKHNLAAPQAHVEDDGHSH